MTQMELSERQPPPQRLQLLIMMEMDSVNWLSPEYVYNNLVRHGVWHGKLSNLERRIRELAELGWLESRTLPGRRYKVWRVVV